MPLLSIPYSIAEAYLEYKDIDGLSRVVDVNEIGNNDYSLSIPLYVRNPEQGVETEKELVSSEELCGKWLEKSLEVHRGYESARCSVRLPLSCVTCFCILRWKTRWACVAQLRPFCRLPR